MSNITFFFSFIYLFSYRAFSAAESIEGAYFVKYNKIITLSEQQLLDCVNGGAYTCTTGGNSGVAFDWLVGKEL